MISSIGTAAGAAIEARGKMWRGLALNLSWGLVLIAIVWFPSVAMVRGRSPLDQLLPTCAQPVGLSLRREDLPPGMLPRLFLTLAFILCLTVAASRCPRARDISAAPVALLTGFLTLELFVDRIVRQNLFARVRSQLRLRSARSSRKGRRTS